MIKPHKTPEKNTRPHRRLPSLRSLLVVLVAAAVVPIFLFSAWLIVLQSEREMEAVQEQLLGTAQAIAIDVDREVASTMQSLQTLALGFDLETGREFAELSNRMLSAQHAWQTVIVRDQYGKPLVTVSRRSEETQSADSVDDESLEIFKAEKGSGTGSPLAFLLGSSVGVHVPIRIEQKFAYLASVLMDPQIFVGLLTKHKVSPDWLVSILDRKKIIVASTRFADKLFGKPAQLFREDSRHSAPGHLFRSKIENIPSYVVLSAAPVSGWSVAVAVPASVVEAPYYRTLWLIVGIGLLCLIAGITIAYLIGRKVARPFERLAATAKDRAQGKLVAAPNRFLAELETINEALDESAHLLKEREHERDYFSEQLDVRLNDLTGLHKLTTGLLTIEERQALYNEIVTGALILLKAEKSSLHLTDQKAQRLDLVAQIGFDSESVDAGHFPAEGLAGTVMATRRPVVIEDIEDNAIFNDQQRQTASAAAIRAAFSFPLTERGGDIIGALSTYFSQRSRPTQWQEILIDLYAQYCVNIIQQMLAKEELRTHNNGLEERVKDHAEKLEEAYVQRINDLTRQRELEKELREAQKMELVGTLAGGIAHDFNNMLNIIHGYASLLEEGKESIEPVHAIKETVQRGASVVKQLLAVARKTEAKFEATDLNSLIRRLMDLLAQTFPKDIIVAGEFDPQIPPVMLDSNQISQAIINLCINARDAMPNGGKLTIQTQYLDAMAARQRFAGAKETSYGCIAVSDTGTGVQNDAKEHIFEPFFTTKGPGRGTGLGLSVVYGIMQTHDGFIHFNSEPGQGTIFYLCFPIRQATGLPALEKKPAETKPDPSPQGATILIVDDEPNQIILLRRVFEKEGYTVLTAAEGDSALDVFSDHRDEIAVVLLDLGLPGTNGWDVFRKMREIQPKIKVVFVTGYVLPDLDLARVDKDSYGVVMKPYDLTDIVRKIALTLQSAQS
jgi:signal transduction histidine kinase/CheY-like chemotaxis protein